MDDYGLKLHTKLSNYHDSTFLQQIKIFRSRANIALTISATSSFRGKRGGL